MKDERVIELVKECGLDWRRGFVPLFDGDPTNRYAVLVEAVAAETREECARRCKEMSESVGMLQGPVAEGMSLAYGAAAEIIRGML